MRVSSVRDTGQHEQRGIQTLDKCLCGVSTETPQCSKRSPTSPGNWHTFCKEHEVKVMEGDNVPFSTQYTTNKRDVSIDQHDQISCEQLEFVFHGRSLDGSLAVFSSHSCQQMLCPGTNRLSYWLRKLVYIN